MRAASLRKVGRTTAALELLNADDALASLLRDVLGDLGVGLAQRDESRGLVLLVLNRQLGPDRLRRLVQRYAPEPVVAVLPFEDERLDAQARSAGAVGCYALGTPLANLREQIARAMRA